MACIGDAADKHAPTAESNTSREAAKECCPRRKPWLDK
jgi:hypothetical protein